MKRIAKIGLILMLVAVLLAPAAWAREIVTAVKLNQVQQVNGDLTMYVSMKDANGYPCTGDYRADQFSISVDGEAMDAASVTKFDPQQQGIHYVFSVDVSRSLTTEMMNNVRASLIEFVNAMGPHDRVSIITFGERVTERIINSTDRAAINQTIQGIQANEGMTALYKGVIDAVSIAASTGGRSAILVITDGKNDPTEDMKAYTKESIYDRVQSAQVPLYCVGVNDNNGVDTESLIELATVTGGDQFVLKANEISSSLNYVQLVMRSAYVLKANLINTQNKTGFDALSSFRVGFQPDDAPFVASNELLQNINWKNVPVPVVTPEPTPVPTATPIPQISLSLDEDEIRYDAKGIVITGAIEVEQGSVLPTDLVLTVNGEYWRISEMMRNGNGYTFTAEGTITDTTDMLEVQAEISGIGIASRIHRIEIILPTQAPTATPAPVLSVELDENDRGVVYEPGKVIHLTGVINVQGEINPADLTLYVNGTFCEMNTLQINRSQYEFSADCALQPGAGTELSVQVQLNGSEIYSRVQRLFLTTPSPTPNPELYFSLSDAGVEYVEGMPVVVRGNIEILSGVVAPEDLALYVNNIKWDMELEILSDGTYGFNAVNYLADPSITQLDVKIRLQSNTKIVSNSEKLAVATPVPTASPSPTPRPVVTPPPTAVPTTPPATPVVTATPVPVQTTFIDTAMEKVMEFINPLIDNGKIWYLAGAAGLMLILIIVLIVLLVIRAKKKRKEQEITPLTNSTNFSIDSRDDDDSAGRTRRDDDGDATVRSDGGRTGESDFVSDSYPAKETYGKGGTVQIDRAESTTRIDPEEGGRGTVRLDDDEPEMGGGTMRIEEEVKSIQITMDERLGGQIKEARGLYLECNDELILGRSDAVDVVIGDGAVSSKHLMITYDGEGVYIVDLGSTNGTKLNGEKIMAREPRKLSSGDTVLIGKTTLTFRFDESGM